MEICNNISRPEPPKTTNELLLIICNNLNINCPNVSRFDEFGHRGPHIYSLHSVEEQNYMYYNYFLAREWIANKNFPSGDDRLATKKVLKECEKRGYKHVADEVQYYKVHEISLPNGKLILDASNSTAVATFPGYVIFANDEKPSEFLDAMNDLIKYIEDQKDGFIKIMNMAKKKSGEIRMTISTINKYVKSLRGTASNEAGKLTVCLDNNIKLSIKSDYDQIWASVFPKIIQEYHDIFSSDKYNSLNCDIVGATTGNWSPAINVCKNMSAIAITDCNAIISNLSDDSWNSNFTAFTKIAIKLRTLYGTISDKFGEETAKSLIIESTKLNW